MEKSLAQSNLYPFDREKAKLFGTIVGTDEVGRGPLAGPVVAAAVVLDLSKEIEGLRDSKKLSEKKRENLFPIIMEEALSVGISVLPAQTIDHINILQASLLAMDKSIEKLKASWDIILVDGNKKIPQREDDKQLTVVKGDATSASIAAASIVAKVIRDRIMVKYDSKYPNYGFAAHKGYPTQKHRDAVLEFGLTPIHRVSFCSKLTSQMTLDLF